jgi:hypothetical protein
VAAVLRGGGAVESGERKGGVREMQELEGILYRAKRGAEGARLRRWAAVPAVVAINGVRLGGVAVLGGEEVRWQRVGVCARRGGGAAPECGRRRGRGEEGGAAAGGRGRLRHVGPTCRWLCEREREGRRAVWARSGAGPRLGKRKEEVRWAAGLG